MPGEMLKAREITDAIIGAAIEVHRHLGPGCLESSYEACLCHELRMRGFAVRSQAKLPIEYKGLKLAEGYRIDLIVEETVVVEIKAVDTLVPVHEAQLITYLRLSGFRVGLLLNFNVAVLKDGILRRVL
jgi:GxxExxY protein